jgi:hypothetical protein
VTTTDDTEVSRPASGWMTAPTVIGLTQWFTRWRVLLAVPVVAALFYLVRPGPVWPAVAAAAFGEFIQLWAAAHLHKNVRMVNSGPYGLLRNPMYAGRFFVGLGFVLLLQRWYLVLAYVVTFALYAQVRVLGEEARLRDLFGEDYLAYCRSVNRWFPRPWRRPPSAARWSWEAVRRNHQLRVTAGVALGLVLLWWRGHSLG